MQIDACVKEERAAVAAVAVAVVGQLETAAGPSITGGVAHHDK